MFCSIVHGKGTGLSFCVFSGCCTASCRYHQHPSHFWRHKHSADNLSAAYLHHRNFNSRPYSCLYAVFLQLSLFYCTGLASLLLEKQTWVANFIAVIWCFPRLVFLGWSGDRACSHLSGSLSSHRCSGIYGVSSSLCFLWSRPNAFAECLRAFREEGKNTTSVQIAEA